MAVSGISNSATGSIYGNRNVMSGLASGLDTESMMKNMTSALNGKINKQLQNKQNLLWKQEGYQSISNKLVELSTKYTSYSSSTNLMSGSFFDTSIVTSKGENSKYITATGKTTSNILIDSVDRLASTSTLSSKGLKNIDNPIDISAGKSIDLAGQVDVSTVGGQYMTMKYGNSAFTIYLDSTKEYTNAQDVADEINTQLKNVQLSSSSGSTITMGDKMEAKVNADGKMEFAMKDTGDSNSLEIMKTSSADLLKAVHMSVGDKMTGSGTITGSEAIVAADLTTKKDASEMLAGTSITMTYNGTRATINIPNEKTNKEAYDKIFGAGKTSEERAKALTEYLQGETDKAFGYGRVKVENTSLSMFRPSFSVADNATETLSIDNASAFLLGKGGILGIEAGASNRVNVGAKLGDLTDTSGNKILDSLTPVGQDSQGRDLYSFEINGQKIGEFTKDSTVSEIVSAINQNKSAGVKATYSKTTNQFVFTSTHGGAGGKIEMTGSNNLAAKLFGDTADLAGNSHLTYTAGEDAVMQATINGTKVTLKSDSNTFNIDGFKVTANGLFTSATGGSVSFDSKVDSEKIVTAIKGLVEDYNAMIKEVNEKIRQKPSGYAPLTDEQKADMSESEIKAWEDKAKEGNMFSDTDLVGLADSMRFIFSASGGFGKELEAMGITVSSDYSDNGKVVLDESKLKDMLNSDPDTVKNVFTSPLGTTTKADGTTVDNPGAGGIMARLHYQTEKYAGITGSRKGILIEKAGSKYSVTATLSNSIQKQIDAIDKTVDDMKVKLSNQIDSYTRQFTQLEKLISEMNSQTSALMGMMGQ